MLAHNLEPAQTKRPAPTLLPSARAMITMMERPTMTTATAPTLNGDASASVVTIPSAPRRGKRATVVSAQVAAPLPEVPGDPVLALIERVTRDPSADLDKLERILAMHSRLEAKAREREFNEKMAEAQKLMEPINADARNPETKSKYATLAKLDRVIRPIYSKLGFAPSFNTSPDAPPEHVRVLLALSNCGHTAHYQIDMPTDGKGPKGGSVMTRTHAVGSGVSYGQRYLLKLAFNLSIDSSADDDGNAAGRTGGGVISAEQVQRIKSLAMAVQADMRRFCAFLGVPSIEAIPAARFEHAIASLAAKGSKSLAAPAAGSGAPPSNSERALAASGRPANRFDSRGRA